jgi:hypothetical protein
MTLEACPACGRHIRKTESLCPFCAADVAAHLAALPPRALPTARLGRAALFAFATASAGSLACATDAEEGQGKGGLRDGGAGGDSANTGAGGALIYGAPPAGGTPNLGTGGRSSGGTPGAGGTLGGTGGTDAGPSPDDAGMDAIYGGPPPDSGFDAGFGALYGDPGPVPIYGAPPPERR